MTDLLPCPFCGLDPNNHKTDKWCVCQHDGLWHRDIVDMTPETWNTRPIEVALQSEIRVLEATIKGMTVHDFDRDVATEELMKQQRRIDDLESNILEADAQWNIDKKPRDIYAAELAMVRVASIGAEALANEPLIRKRIDELVTFVKMAKDMKYRDCEKIAMEATRLLEQEKE